MLRARLGFTRRSDGYISTRGEAVLKERTFSDQEKAEIRVSIQQFKFSIIREFTPNETQLRLITEKLDHLRESVDKLNGFDWNGVVINT